MNASPARDWSVGVKSCSGLADKHLRAEGQVAGRARQSGPEPSLPRCSELAREVWASSPDDRIDGMDVVNLAPNLIRVKFVAKLSSKQGAEMQAILADVVVSMSEFKRNPAAVLREANKRPVAVLNHNKAAFYMVEPELFQVLMEELADRELLSTVRARLADKSKAIEVDIDDL